MAVQAPRRRGQLRLVGLPGCVVAFENVGGWVGFAAVDPDGVGWAAVASTRRARRCIDGLRFHCSAHLLEGKFMVLFPVHRPPVQNAQQGLQLVAAHVDVDEPG
jgi:hypothetical protein